ncbi:MAG: sodium extrusion protein NatB [Pirellulaceae bacterium]|nr:MAG: sodium extrusion protein NatB [Pirellulaceae bacterium]
MTLRNVGLVFAREVRDQLRDRRMLFTVVVLPLVLYPLMGTVMVQVAQFLRDHPTRVCLIGTKDLPDEPPLVDRDRFHLDLVDAEERHLLPVVIQPQQPGNIAASLAEVDAAIRRGEYDAAVYIPPGFAEQLEEIRRRLAEGADSQQAALSLKSVPSPSIYFNTASDRSQVASQRVERVLRRWREAIVRENLRKSRVPQVAAEPFQLQLTDVAEVRTRRAAQWSKILPFVLLIWALTGAFYPAVDLCAGEKERGTLETLLASPAERTEIVWGKLLTTMLFSSSTAVLHLVSLTITMIVFSRQFAAQSHPTMALGMPPVGAVGWLLLALIPASLLFSGLAIALAAFARSTKEGHYYLTPLLLVMLPLMLLPMSPAFSLSLGSSLIPVAGLLVWVRAFIEGHYGEALRYALPVLLVTGGCSWLAVRWAVDQFCNENVLFREGERGGLRVWTRHLMQHRRATPTVAEALFAGVLLLVIRFFAMMFAAAPQQWDDLLRMVTIQQLAMVATPILLMTLILTNNPIYTLGLKLPRPSDLLVAVVLAVTAHPIVLWLGSAVRQMFPMGDELQAQLESVGNMINQAPLVWMLLTMALLPAVCEELAFRGFILSGLRQMGHKWAAIVISAIFFGWMHSVFHQQVVATFVGILIGYLVFQTNSIFPAVTFHAIHNGLALGLSRWESTQIIKQPLWQLLYRTTSDGLLPTTSALVVAVGVIIVCGLYLYQRPGDVLPEAEAVTGT